MMDNNYNLLSQINSEADETLAETIWGKPANDIITGINNNSTKISHLLEFPLSAGVSKRSILRKPLSMGI